MKTQRTMSRRSFLGLGALATAGAATAGLVGCAPQQKPSDADAAESTIGFDWL